MSDSGTQSAGSLSGRLELLNRALKEKGIDVTKGQAISLRANAGPCLLSFAQQRLWFLYKLDPTSTAYNLANVIRLVGGLNLSALERSLSEIVRRHESLRTTFTVIDGSPFQIISPPYRIKLEIIDLSEMDEQERETLAMQLVAEETRRPFDLEREPLVRTKLIKMSAEDHISILTIHHITSDGWSSGIMVRELAALYEAYLDGRESPLEDLPIQYADYAVWQREGLQGEGFEKRLSYWKEKLAGLEPLCLPTIKPRPPVRSFRGNSEAFFLKEELGTDLKRLSQAESATMFMTLLAGFKVLLSRYTNQQDIAVGTPIAGRNRREIEGLIGFFVNSLVMRTDLSGSLTFTELLSRVKETALGAYTHEDMPFEKLVEELQPKRDLHTMPLFQVMFVMQSAPHELLQLKGLQTKPVNVELGKVDFDLILVIQEFQERLLVVLQYQTDLFDPETIERMAGHFEVLLESIVANPEQNINDLALLTPGERQQILITWNQTAHPFPRQACIHELFEAQAEISAEAIAVQSGEQALSYRQLNERANQLGHYLRSRGVGAEVRVGICLSRRIEMVVAVLGVLKAGGAYVPLDPEYPAERLAFMVEDSGAWLVISERQWSARVREWCPEVVEIEEQEEEIGRQSRSKPETGLSSGNLAYVIYTSGSTGRPKGVAIEHRNTVALLAWAKASYGQEELRSVVAATSICFDLSVYEMLVPLVVGGKVEVVSSLLEVGEGESGRQGSLINTVPSGMEELVRRRRVPESVETVNLAGEALEERLVKAVYEETRVKRVVNLYGPTECTTYSTYEEEKEGEKVSIGRPIWNTRVYVRDRRQGVVPVGVEGELYIGGEGVARGYMGRAEQTAERFMPEESGGGGEEGGGRMYRTGDRGRYRRDGKIEYRGRGDEQVKVRGYRIELGEVEGVMNEQEEVRDAVVVVKEDEVRGKQLVGYVVWKEGRQGRVEELKREMKEKLPEYMIPSLFVTLEALPLTPNGKVDRRTLPDPELATLQLEAGLVEPRDALEFQLIQIWEQVLGIHPIGIRDDFFNLGGHSLLAASLMSRIEGAIQKSAPVAVLLQGATIEYLAGHLRQQEGSPSLGTLIAIEVGDSRPPFFCIHPIGGNALCYVALSRHLGEDQPFYAFQAPGLYGERAPHTSIEEMAAHYIEEMRLVQPLGPYLIGGWSMGGIVAVEMARQLQAYDQQVTLLALIDSMLMNPEELAEFDRMMLFTAFAKDLGLLLEQVEFSRTHFDQISEDDQLEYIMERAKSNDIIPTDIQLSQFRHFLKVYESNFRAVQNYRALSIPAHITLLRATETSRADSDPHRGWRELATEGITVHAVPGDHYTILREPYVQTLAEVIRTSIDNSM